jgi:hypothetical protein
MTDKRSAFLSTIAHMEACLTMATWPTRHLDKNQTANALSPRIPVHTEIESL